MTKAEYVQLWGTVGVLYLVNSWAQLTVLLVVLWKLTTKRP